MSNVKFYKTCSPECPFFPDMSVQDSDWTYDEEKCYKVRKEPKEFLCLYDNHLINWKEECPRFQLFSEKNEK